jgi:HEAT repeat protein
MLMFRHPNVKRLAATRNVKGLIKALDSRQDFKTRYDASQALKKIGLPAEDALIDALVDGKTELRREAARILEEIGDARAVDPLIGALADEDLLLPDAAARALGGIGDARAVDPLIGALEHEAISLDVAAEALGKLGDPRAIQPLRAKLKDGDGHLQVSIMYSLAELGDHSVVELLLNKFEHDEDYIGRRNAARTLGQLGDRRKSNRWTPSTRAVTSLISGLNDFSSLQARFNSGLDSRECRALWICIAQALGEFGDRRAVDPLLHSALEDIDSERRIEAISALAAIGDVQALAPLIQVLLSDDPEDVRVHAALALPAFRAARAVDSQRKSVVDSLRKASEDDREAVRSAARKSLDALDAKPRRGPNRV